MLALLVFMEIVKQIPIKENSDRNPINPYGQTKLDDEFLAEKYSNRWIRSNRSSDILIFLEKAKRVVMLV